MTSERLGWEPLRGNGFDLYQRNGRFEVGTPAVRRDDTTLTKGLGFWAPRRWVSAKTMDVEGFVLEIEELVRTRGFVTYDGQVLTRLDRVGPWDANFEAISIDHPWDVPPRRPWGTEQRAFFGPENPYQMADEGGAFTSSNLTIGVADPYLTSDERIIGIVHGVTDRCYFTCPCHYDTVVYTTRHRLVCMTCGATHLVLRDPLVTAHRQAITADDWVQLFDDKGTRHHEAVDLVIVDVVDLESAPTIWTTDQWDQALADFILRGRSTPEEYAAAIRGTERDASIFMEAGFQPVAQPPSPAFQIMEASLDVDMMDTAGHALAAGVSAYLTAYVEPQRLLDAVPDLFQVIELLLKVRLEVANPLGLRDHPNNPTVLSRLSDAGVVISPDDIDTVARLRRLRNGLQHASARFNHRATLALCRSALLFIDRFTEEELNAWIGDVIATDDWYQLLSIEEIRARAIRVAGLRLADHPPETGATITVCPRCSVEGMLRPAPNTGASCAVCGHVVAFKDD
ncbi:MAG TPA: hypothetical protein VFP54_06445 [Acidimicrobiales bacterium]|nr:hypothetical protein [Acidimicrobiales bacterium]